MYKHHVQWEKNWTRAQIPEQSFVDARMRSLTLATRLVLVRGHLRVLLFESFQNTLLYSEINSQYLHHAVVGLNKLSPILDSRLQMQDTETPLSKYSANSSSPDSQISTPDTSMPTSKTSDLSQCSLPLTPTEQEDFNLDIVPLESVLINHFQSPSSISTPLSSQFTRLSSLPAVLANCSSPSNAVTRSSSLTTATASEPPSPIAPNRDLSHYIPRLMVSQPGESIKINGDNDGDLEIVDCDKRLVLCPSRPSPLNAIGPVPLDPRFVRYSFVVFFLFLIYLLSFNGSAIQMSLVPTTTS
jgi:hypothetical protein